MFYIFSPTRSVVLPSEDRGNTENMQAALVSHRTLDGTLKTYRRVDDYNTRSYSFSSVKHRDYLEFIQMLKESAGRIIHFEDSKTVSFTGRLAPADVELTSERETNNIIYRNFTINIKGAANA